MDNHISESIGTNVYNSKLYRNYFLNKKTSNARRFDSLDPRLNDKISVYCFALLQKLVTISNVSLYVR